MAEPLEDWMGVTRPHGVQLLRRRLQGRERAVQPESDAVLLLWVRTGRVALEVDGERTELGADELVLLPRGQGYRLQALEDSALWTGAYSGSRCPVTSVWAGLPAQVHIEAESVAAEPRVAAVATLLEGELDAPQEGSQPLVGSLMDVLMVYLLRAWSAQSARGTHWMAGLQDPMLAVPLRRVHQQPAEAWTVERLARVAGVSRAVFARHFSDRMGESPMEYVRRWRMALAARMLLYGDASVASIAEQVGYSSEFAFNRAFKKVVGQPPGRFRREVGARG